jgi:NAD(P)-dependent dehydrogenase (short-subunit alcohol dehydrogenase family)
LRKEAAMDFRNTRHNQTIGISALGTAAGLAGYALWRRSRLANIEGKVALITGSSRGLGLALARECARLGCDLVLCARGEAELHAASAELSSFGNRVLPIVCDVGDREQVERMMAHASSHFGRIDLLFNNAGIITVGPLETQTLADFEEAMRVMFWGIVYPTLAVVPQMIARGSGRIANTTSIGGKVSVPHLIPYNCAKFAAVGFSEGIHAELRRHGIRVTTVVPGLMRTGSHRNAYFKGDHRAEYTWFSLGATLPLVSMNADRAARAIVRAVRRGQPEIILTPQARAIATLHGIAPGLTSELMAMVSAFLPRPGGEAGTGRHLGRDSETMVTRSPLTALGRSAARRFNQEPPASAADLGQTTPEQREKIS